MDIGDIDRIRKEAKNFGWQLESIHFSGENVYLKWTDTALVTADIGAAPVNEPREFQNWLEARALAVKLRSKIFGVHASVQDALTEDYHDIQNRHSRIDVSDLNEEG